VGSACEKYWKVKWLNSMIGSGVISETSGEGIYRLSHKSPGEKTSTKKMAAKD
jgi:hypothetical protein